MHRAPIALVFATLTACSAPPAPTSPATAQSKAVEPAQMPLQAMIETPGTISMYRLDGITLVRVEDRLFEARGDDLVADPKLEAGLEPRGGVRWRIDHVEGYWPDRAVLVATDVDPAGSTEGMVAYYFTWSPLHERWIQRGRSLPRHAVTQLVRWIDRRVVAVEQTRDVSAGDRLELRVVAGPSFPGPVPAELRGAGPFMGVSGVTALPSGQMIFAGDEFVGGPAGSFASWIDTWKPGDPSVIEPAPAADEIFFLTGHFLARGDEVLLTGAGRYSSAYLARREHERWSRVDVPLPHPLDGIWEEPGGRVWMRSSCELWATTGAGLDGWAKILPSKGGDAMVPTDQIWPRAPGDVWIVAERSSTRSEVLLRTGSGHEPIAIPPIEPLPRAFKLEACRDRW